MKRIGIIILTLVIAISLSACRSRCDNCGDTIEGKAVQAGGRNYCDYNCYMSDFFGL